MGGAEEEVRTVDVWAHAGQEGERALRAGPGRDRPLCHEATQLDEGDCLDLPRVVQRRVPRPFRTGALLDEADTESMLSCKGSGGFSIDAGGRGRAS